VSRAREQLRTLYDAALAAVDGAGAVQAALVRRPPVAPVHAVAIGKAASAMLTGAERALGERLERVLLITKHGHSEPRWETDPRVTPIEAGHPLPDEHTLRAGQALLDFIDRAPQELLFLISGGASSLVEVPVAGVTLADLQRLNRHLLASGLDIHQMNRVRQAVSRIKGGRLAAMLGGRRVRLLMISDVAGDEPAVIGSGLLVPPVPGPLPELPFDLASLLRRPAPLAQPEDFSAIDSELIARNDDALAAAGAEAARLGLPVHRHRRFIDGDARAAGRDIAGAALTGLPGVHLWGGEPTVVLPDKPGRGGRMQTLALAAAELLVGSEVVLLAAGTDGSDGPNEDAGAVVDGGSWERALAAGRDPARALAEADAGSALAASGDLIRTGPTGTNVMDVMFALRRGASEGG
jgi:glycerate 2-kinase